MLDKLQVRSTVKQFNRHRPRGSTGADVIAPERRAARHVDYAGAKFPDLLSPIRVSQLMLFPLTLCPEEYDALMFAGTNLD